jgi:site-specific DNA-methyltransferase (adenine-specific)
MESSGLFVDQAINGDCIEVLSGLPACSVDLIFADPPYNLQLRNDLWRPNSTRVDGVDDEWDRFSSFAEYDAFTRQWLAACRRVLKDTGTIWVIGTYHNIYRVGAILQELGFWILNDVVWVKSNPMPNFRGVRFTNAHETLLWAQKVRGGRYTFNHHAMKALNGDLQMRSDWRLPLCMGKERIRVNGKKAHTTQKPERLLERVILSSSNPGDLVLDPFFGTGTTGAVARHYRRHWIGIERKPEYVEIARERIACVQPVEPSEMDGADRRKRSLRRISPGMLVEAGLVRPGQLVAFDPEGRVTATVLQDGRLQYQESQGSIHQIARQIKEGPVNGWQHWYYQDDASGEWLLLDRLRQVAREQLQHDLAGDD